MNEEFNIVVCGSPRVGKSTLVNALCGKPVAKTSPSLNSCTDRIETYTLRQEAVRTNTTVAHPSAYVIKIWDTPGIESWTKKDVQTQISTMMQASQPLCMIYCASPGSFARLDHLQWLVDTCIQSNIFFALVCTNKYAGSPAQRQEVVNNFHSLLSNYHQLTRDVDHIRYYSDVALCTSVNSTIYEDSDHNIRKDVEGVNELIFGIMTSLKDERQVAWCYTIAGNESFWISMKAQLMEWVHEYKPAVESYIRENGKDIGKSFIEFIVATVVNRRR